MLNNDTDLLVHLVYIIWKLSHNIINTKSMFQEIRQNDTILHAIICQLCRQWPRQTTHNLLVMVENKMLHLGQWFLLWWENERLVQGIKIHHWVLPIHRFYHIEWQGNSVILCLMMVVHGSPEKSLLQTTSWCFLSMNVHRVCDAITNVLHLKYDFHVSICLSRLYPFLYITVMLFLFRDITFYISCTGCSKKR